MSMTKITAEDLESKEKREIEVTNLKDSDLMLLETFYFPENKNPEKMIRKHIESQDISADQKAKIWDKLKDVAQAVLQVGKRIYHVGRKILDFVWHLIKQYPNLTVGLALGAVFGTLIAGIPVIGWIFGTLAQVFLPLLGGIVGYREDIAEKAFKRKVYDAINDDAVEKTIEQEMQIYKPLNTPAQSAPKNDGTQFKIGLDRGIARGTDAIKSMLVAQSESKFGKETANDLEGLLANVDSLDSLSGVGIFLLECTSSNEFIQMTSDSFD